MEKVKLGQLTNIKTGRLDVNAENPNGKYPFFTCSKNHTYIDEYAFDGESVLVAGNGDLNVKYYNGKFNAYQRTYVIQANENLNGKFLYYFLDSYVEKLREQSIGGVIKYIKLGNLTDAEIPLPNLANQQRIAAILDQADAIIQNNRAIVQKYDALTQSLFLDMFGDPVKNEKGWEKKEFSKVAKNENSKRVPVKQSDRDEREGEYPYYGATGIIDTIDDYKFDGEYLLIAEDGKNLLFRKKNNAFMANGKFWVNNHAHILSCNNICNLKYLEFFLNSIDLSPFISGIDQIKLNKASLDRIPVIVPPIELQNQFAERVSVIEAQKQQAQLELAKSEELFQSLLQRAFKGELS